MIWISIITFIIGLVAGFCPWLSEPPEKKDTETEEEEYYNEYD